jgi:hypothetical protein
VGDDPHIYRGFLSSNTRASPHWLESLKEVPDPEKV